MIRIFLILSVIVIGLWEVYSPLPDFSRQEFEHYYYNCKALKSNVPVSVLILLKIEDKEHLKVFKKRYRFKSNKTSDWVKYLNLTDAQIKKVIKYEEYENTLHTRKSSNSRVPS